MKKYAVILFLMFSCNSITMVDVTKENLSVGINGLVSDIVLWRGGAVTLTIYKDGKFEDVGVGKKFYELIKKGDYFTKERNSNKCSIKRNDSIICLDCIEIEKEVKDSLGKINEWETNQKNAWKLAK